MLRVVAALSMMVALASAIVCPPNVCDSIKQPVLDCKGGVIVKGGFCGCTDLCALVEGEECQIPMFGMPAPAVPCDLGLKCVRHNLEGHLLSAKCTKTGIDADLGRNHLASKRTTQTRCEQMRLSSMISMVVYEGQWFAKCDSDGNFLPMQCDNTRHCFCVDTLTGTVKEGTKVLGAAEC